MKITTIIVVIRCPEMSRLYITGQDWILVNQIPDYCFFDKSLINVFENPENQNPENQ